MSRPQREDPFSTHKLVAATRSIDAIGARIGPLLALAAAEGSELGPAKRGLDHLVSEGIRSLPAVTISDEQRGNYSAWRNYQISAASLAEIVHRAAALTPPVARTVADATEQPQSTEGLKVDYKKLEAVSARPRSLAMVPILLPPFRNSSTISAL